MLKRILLTVFAVAMTFSPATAKSHHRFHHTYHSTHRIHVQKPRFRRHALTHRQLFRRHGRFLSLQSIPGDIYALVTSTALRYGVDPLVAHAIVRKESGYNCAPSTGNGGGIMQVNRQTAASMGVRGSLRSCSNGLEAGMRYLRRKIDEHGATCHAYSAFNNGFGGCTAYGRQIMSLTH